LALASTPFSGLKLVEVPEPRPVTPGARVMRASGLRAASGSCSKAAVLRVSWVRLSEVSRSGACSVTSTCVETEPTESVMETSRVSAVFSVNAILVKEKPVAEAAT